MPNWLASLPSMIVMFAKRTSRSTCSRRSSSGEWEYLGSGYLNPGDVLLAAGVEASIRVGREALMELWRGPPASPGDRAW
jgi:hypothetical protein